MKLPTEDGSVEDSSSAGTHSASHLMKKLIAQHKHHSNEEVPSTHANPASSSRVDDTNEDLMTRESSVHIKTEPDDIPTQPPFTSDASEDGPQPLIKTEPYDSTQTDSSSTHHSLLKQEPLSSSSSLPVNKPENTRLDKCLKIQPAENNFVVFKSAKSCVKSSLIHTQQHQCSWPFRLMQKAMNPREDDTEEQRDHCDSELSSSINDFDDIFKCFTEDWTSEESVSHRSCVFEPDLINILQPKENNSDIFIYS